MSTRFTKETSLGKKPFIYPEEVEFLQNLFMNSDKYVFDDPATKITSTRRDINEPETLKVALISFKMPNPGKFLKSAPYEDGKPFVQDEKYSCVRFRDKNTALSLEDVVNIIAQCLDEYNSKEEPIHFLLFNELALSYESSEHLLSKIQSKFVEKKIRTTISILGSYHCDKTYFNKSPIISPFMNDFKYKVVSEVKKQTPAIKQKEFIRTPDGTWFYRYSTPYGIIMVWICLDMYDPNLVLKLIRTNYRLSLSRKSNEDEADLVDILFIPSYNADKKQNVLNIAKNISKYARTTVFLSNDSTNLEKKEGWNDNICYHFGEEIIPESKEQTIPLEKCTISIYKIPKWPQRYEQIAGPFDSEFSSLFSKVLGLEVSSFVAI